MSKTTNNTADLRTRLLTFLLVLAIGFALGWFKAGSTTTEAPQEDPVAATQVDTPEDPSDADSAQDQGQSQDQSASATDTEAAQDPAPSQDGQDDAGTATVAPERGPTVKKDGWYTSKEEVALYIHTYGRLPGNFISKTKARDRGWVASEGNLDEVCPGMSIGGSRFYDDDQQLPYKKGRQWTECDINYHGGYRGAERIVFSNDGLIFYTGDHYETFEQLY